jgi:hypothetical protein
MALGARMKTWLAPALAGVLLLGCHRADGAAPAGPAQARGLNTCPVLTSRTVLPLGPRVMKLEATGADTDCVATGDSTCGQREPVTLRWTASSGTVTRGSPGVAIYRCAQPGPVTLTVTVSDAQCHVTDEVEVTCGGASASL